MEEITSGALNTLNVDVEDDAPAEDEYAYKVVWLGLLTPVDSGYNGKGGDLFDPRSSEEGYGGSNNIAGFNAGGVPTTAGSTNSIAPWGGFLIACMVGGAVLVALVVTYKWRQRREYHHAQEDEDDDDDAGNGNHSRSHSHADHDNASYDLEDGPREHQGLGRDYGADGDGDFDDDDDDNSDHHSVVTPKRTGSSSRVAGFFAGLGRGRSKKSSIYDTGTLDARVVSQPNSEDEDENEDNHQYTPDTAASGVKSPTRSQVNHRALQEGSSWDDDEEGNEGFEHSYAPSPANNGQQQQRHGTRMTSPPSGGGRKQIMDQIML
jgi:hypothetical protein